MRWNTEVNGSDTDQNTIRYQANKSMEQFIMCVIEILLFCPSSDYNMMKNIYDGLTYTM